MRCSFPESVNKYCVTAVTAAAKENKPQNTPRGTTQPPPNKSLVSWLLYALWAGVTLIPSVILLLLKEA